MTDLRANDAQLQAFSRWVAGRLTTRTEHCVMWRLRWSEDGRGDWVELLRATPDAELLMWRNFGTGTLRDLRRLVPFRSPSPVGHPWWLSQDGFQR